MLACLNFPQKSKAAEPFHSVEECVTSCKEALSVADQVIEALKDENTKLDDTNQILKTRVQDLSSSNEQLVKQANAWYRDPKIVGTLGLLVGTFAGVWASHH
jgi:FtsZ-binding cell division protein ZapB